MNTLPATGNLRTPILGLNALSARSKLNWQGRVAKLTQVTGWRLPPAPHGKPVTRRGSQMSDVATAQELIQSSFPAHRHGNIKAAIYAAYRKLRLSTERRAESIWYATAKRIEANEMDALREEKARQEAHAQQLRLHQTAAYLRQIDADFYSDTIDTLERVTHRVGMENSAMD